MSEVNAASLSIVELCERHNIDPFSIIGLLALSALIHLDLAKLRFWRNVAEQLEAAHEARASSSRSA